MDPFWKTQQSGDGGRTVSPLRVQEHVLAVFWHRCGDQTFSVPHIQLLIYTPDWITMRAILALHGRHISWVTRFTTRTAALQKPSGCSVGPTTTTKKTQTQVWNHLLEMKRGKSFFKKPSINILPKYFFILLTEGGFLNLLESKTSEIYFNIRSTWTLAFSTFGPDSS